jgi:hypothetical protein
MKTKTKNLLLALCLIGLTSFAQVQPNIDYETTLGGAEYQISISSPLGQTLYSQTSLSYNNEIDFSLYPLGIYFVTIQCNEYQKIFKVIKE